MQFLKRTMTWRSVLETGSVRFCVKPPSPSTSLFTVGAIHMKPLLPRITDAPQVRLWKWVFRRFTSDGNTLTKIPCESCGVVFIITAVVGYSPRCDNLLSHISNFVYEGTHCHHRIYFVLLLRSDHLPVNIFASYVHPRQIVVSIRLKCMV